MTRLPLVSWVVHGLMAAIMGLIVLLIVAGCAPSARGASGILLPAVGPPVSNGYGTVAYDLRATSSQIATGTTQVTRLMEHWAPLASRPFVVTVVARGSLVVDGVERSGCRLLGTGRLFLAYEPSGTVDAAEWEIPLEAQERSDPPSWSWGVWGPIYPGQAPGFLLATNQ